MLPKRRSTADDCAREVLDVVPSVMRLIRTEMRTHRALRLSVPQFRALLFVERSEGTSLNGVAEHLGLTPPSACKLVDGLQGRDFVTRTQSPADRRRVSLEITEKGRRALSDSRRETQKSLSQALAPADGGDLAVVVQSMAVLRRLFGSRGDSAGAGAHVPGARRS